MNFLIYENVYEKHQLLLVINQAQLNGQIRVFVEFEVLNYVPNNPKYIWIIRLISQN